MKPNSLKKLEALGQSIWLDYISRDLITSGKLKQLITEDGLKGITSNPSIFDKAISESEDYENEIQKLKSDKKEVNFVYEFLTQRDVKEAADVFRDLFEDIKHKDGFVSLEVNPHLAYDTKGTIEEARRLWKALDRPNVFIKVPATLEGLPAIKQLISEGININITLLFGLPRYRDVAEAYISGLESRIALGKPIHSISSVASFFLSRIDVLIDPLLEKKMAEKNEKSTLAQKLHGEVAIASAKVAYQIYKEIFTSPRFKKLIEKGANVQRLLWASTSTKNPAYSKIKYVEALIGDQTINTLPMETLNDYLSEGQPELRLEQNIEHAKWVFQTLPGIGINIDTVTEQLEKEGVDKFNQAFDQLMKVLDEKLS